MLVDFFIGQNEDEDHVLAVDQMRSASQVNKSQESKAAVEADPLDLIKNQVKQAKQQYLDLLASGKVKDKKRIESIQNMIMSLDQQMHEMETAADEPKQPKSQPHPASAFKSPNMKSSGRNSSLMQESLISSPTAKMSFNYKPKLVDRKKLTPEELRQLNLSEIFQFYARQHVKNNIRFDQLEQIKHSVNMGEFSCFCRDFGIALPRLAILDAFKKCSDLNQPLNL